ncbi:esterase/lipase family protein [Megalodesulfovibrio paquesii]
MSTVIAILVCLLGLYMLVMTGLTLLFWLYEAVNTGHAARLREEWRLPLGRALARLVRSSLKAQLLAFTLYPLGYLPCARQCSGDSSDPGQPTVLYVHGLYHNPGAWLFFRHWLAGEGFGCSASFGYWSFGTNYFKILDKLADAVDRLQAASPEAPVLLVGHSLGGLLVRGYLSSPRSLRNGRSKVAAAVTLGSPHRGSRLAALGIGGLARSLLYEGELVQELERREALAGPPACPVLALTTPLDNFVLPAHASDIAAPGWIQEAGAPLSHVEMLYHRPTAKRVAAFLRQACVRS